MSSSRSRTSDPGNALPPSVGADDEGRDRAQAPTGERPVEGPPGHGRPERSRHDVTQDERVAPERAGVAEIEDALSHAAVEDRGDACQPAAGDHKGEIGNGVVDDLEAVEQADRIGPRHRADRQAEYTRALIGRIAVLLRRDEARLPDRGKPRLAPHLDNRVPLHDGNPGLRPVLMREASGRAEGARDQEEAGEGRPGETERLAPGTEHGLTPARRPAPPPDPPARCGGRRRPVPPARAPNRG